MNAPTQTDWARLNENTMEWEHNHREDGWNQEAIAPTPTSDIQRKSWAKAVWKKTPVLRQRSSNETN